MYAMFNFFFDHKITNTYVFSQINGKNTRF